jgi:predicted flap endonuclease-1-like 5' DNA nuclease
MPELTAIHFSLLALMLIVGAVVGWVMRANRCVKEKITVSARWQAQMESQQAEHNRLAEQNKSLMEQISQYQASQKDGSNLAKELSDSLKEAFPRRDDLQRQMKEIRGKLDVSVAQREKLTVKEKNDKIFHLSRELTSWQNRVRPLVDRFRERDAEAKALGDELNKARSRLRDLEEIVKFDDTRIEPLDADSLPDGGDASNEPIVMTGLFDTFDLQDQIDGKSSLHEIFQKDSAAPADESVSLDDNPFAAVFDEVSVAVKNDAAADADSLVTDDNDDLQMIKGIGPSIERTLHRLGIVRFHQIAEMSEYDINRVAQQLRGFHSLIYRDDWIGQARDLQYQKKTASIKLRPAAGNGLNLDRVDPS